jgi:uncharacterized protein
LPADAPSCWRLVATGLVVRVRVSPRSSRDAVAGLVATADGPALTVRVRAVPADGAANTAVALTVATWLGLPKSSVSVTAGPKSRVKSLTVIGDPGALAALLAGHLAR